MSKFRGKRPDDIPGDLSGILPDSLTDGQAGRHKGVTLLFLTLYLLFCGGSKNPKKMADISLTASKPTPVPVPRRLPPPPEAPERAAEPEARGRTAADRLLTFLCAVASVVLGALIALNLSVIIKAYVLKLEFPDAFGYFPLISLTEDETSGVRKGDFLLCRKAGAGDLRAGEQVVFFTDGNRDKMAVRQAVSVAGEQITLKTADGEGDLTVPADRIIGVNRKTVPLLGYVIWFLSTVPGFLLCVVLPTAVITETYLWFRRKRDAEEDDEEEGLLAERKALLAERAQLQERLRHQPRRRLSKR